MWALIRTEIHTHYFVRFASFSKRLFDSAQGLGYPAIGEVGPDWILSPGLDRGVTKDAFMSYEPKNFSWVRILICDGHLAKKDHIDAAYLQGKPQRAEGDPGPAIPIDVRKRLPAARYVVGTLFHHELPLRG